MAQLVRVHAAKPNPLELMGLPRHTQCHLPHTDKRKTNVKKCLKTNKNESYTLL